MNQRTSRQTVDLSGYPDLVVIYLGMRVQAPRGLLTLGRIGPQIAKSVAEKPDGLLLHENLIFSLLPPHLGMRQYWRDWESLEAWTRTLPHHGWWTNFLRNPGGTAFWHETYFMRGSMEGIYDAASSPIGMMRFAPVEPARGSRFSARGRAGRGGSASPAPVPEEVEADGSIPAR